MLHEAGSVSQGLFISLALPHWLTLCDVRVCDVDLPLGGKQQVVDRRGLMLMMDRPQHSGTAELLTKHLWIGDEHRPEENFDSEVSTCTEEASVVVGW